MSLLSVLPSDIDPLAEMDRWGVVRDLFGYRLVGRDIVVDDVRISSPVVAWDSASQTATTSSGRFYRLIGEPDEAYAKKVVQWRVARWSLRPDDLQLVKPDDLPGLLDPVKEP